MATRADFGSLWDKDREAYHFFCTCCGFELTVHPAGYKVNEKTGNFDSYCPRCRHSTALPAALPTAPGASPGAAPGPSPGDDIIAEYQERARQLQIASLEKSLKLESATRQPQITLEAPPADPGYKRLSHWFPGLTDDQLTRLATKFTAEYRRRYGKQPRKDGKSRVYLWHEVVTLASVLGSAGAVHLAPSVPQSRRPTWTTET